MNITFIDYIKEAVTCLWSFFVVYDVLVTVCVSGSLSEDAPPPRGLVMSHSALASRSHHPVALARSLPVSVPVWGYRNNRTPQGEPHSGERVSYQTNKNKTKKNQYITC